MRTARGCVVIDLRGAFVVLVAACGCSRVPSKAAPLGNQGSAATPADVGLPAHFAGLFVAGGRCVMVTSWGGDEGGGWQLCLKERSGIIGGHGFFAGGQTRDAYFGEVRRI